jgi:steroid delta-isomerase-like uncharacterized protein
MTTEDLPRRWAAAWASGDVNQLVDLYAEDAIYRHPMFPEPVVGKRALREHFENVGAVFADINPQVVDVISSGDRVAAEIVHVARRIAELHTPAGVLPPAERVESPAGHFFRLDASGLIAEEHQYG